LIFTNFSMFFTLGMWWIDGLTFFT